MILFILTDAQAARSSGFNLSTGLHTADLTCKAWWPDRPSEDLLGCEFERVIELSANPMTRGNYEFIRSRLRVPPATWLKL